jgi:D-psicose/D-tagatose/L-ribulose 3-epimerase
VHAVSLDIGICTWVFGPNPLADTLARIARLGADGVELHGDVDLAVARIRRLLAEHDLTVFSITPPDVDIAHPDGRERLAAIDAYDRLIAFAVDLGRPLVGCHGLVSRHRAIATQDEELSLLTESVRTICDRAAEAGIRVVFEVLNRYETHLVNTAEQAMAMLERVDRENLSVLLDAYHMNIEERDPVVALHAAGPRLGLYHAADSNREGLGRGHVDFGRQLEALRALSYRGPIILECTAPGPDPFTADKGPGYLDVLDVHLRESIAGLRKEEA